MQLTIHTDGGSRGNPGAAGAGVVVLQAEKEIYAAGFSLGVKTNNEAEYLAVIKALEWLTDFSRTQAVKSVQFVLDSKLVVEQLSHHWKIKEPRLKPLAQECWQRIASLPCLVEFTHVLRHNNTRADELVNQAMDAAG